MKQDGEKSESYQAIIKEIQQIKYKTRELDSK